MNDRYEDMNIENCILGSSRYCSGKLPDLTSQEYRIISESLIFKDIQHEELRILLKCLNASRMSYKKGDYAFHAGDKITHIGILFKGSADIVQEDALCRKSIVTKITPKDVFGEGLAASKDLESQVSVIACEDTEILFL